MDVYGKRIARRSSIADRDVWAVKASHLPPPQKAGKLYPG